MSEFWEDVLDVFVPGAVPAGRAIGKVVESTEPTFTSADPVGPGPMEHSFGQMVNAPQAYVTDLPQPRGYIEYHEPAHQQPGQVLGFDDPFGLAQKSFKFSDLDQPPAPAGTAPTPATVPTSAPPPAPGTGSLAEDLMELSRDQDRLDLDTAARSADAATVADLQQQVNLDLHRAEHAAHDVTFAGTKLAGVHAQMAVQTAAVTAAVAAGDTGALSQAQSELASLQTVEHDWLKVEGLARRQFETAQGELQRDGADLRDAQSRLVQDDARIAADQHEVDTDHAKINHELGLDNHGPAAPATSAAGSSDPADAAFGQGAHPVSPAGDAGTHPAEVAFGHGAHPAAVGQQQPQPGPQPEPQPHEVSGLYVPPTPHAPSTVDTHGPDIGHDTGQDGSAMEPDEGSTAPHHEPAHTIVAQQPGHEIPGLIT